jgi:hypothetical protein
MPLKTCCRCLMAQPLDRFPFRYKCGRRGGRAGHCRRCQNKAAQICRDVNREQYNARRKERGREKSEVIIGFLDGHPCVDCGETDIVVLTFDHVRGEKSFSIGRSVRDKPLSKLLDEIAKCDVRCVNCHLRRTANQYQRRLGSVVRLTRRMIYEYKCSNPCVDCGEGNPVVLQFDHRSDKTDAISRLAGRASWATVKAEIAKCDVRCGNCHARASAIRRGYYAWRVL